MGTFSEAVPSWGFERFIERKELENSPYLAGDSFSVRCDVTVYKEINGAEMAAGGVELVGTAAAEENVVVAPVPLKLRRTGVVSVRRLILFFLVALLAASWLEFMC
ncbi:hypothetical protein HU200_044070 [Digitaria exilis]|uniref:MATH domain-containing protein n=1 Tax=Digitaria exilis TaxID=1010633 RepID=A0A835B500_9POAL|nr:hypothetical protein HU200_044070 [Digitaria exilis]